jgi:hypothetical protein
MKPITALLKSGTVFQGLECSFGLWNVVMKPGILPRKPGGIFEVITTFQKLECCRGTLGNIPRALFLRKIRSV